MPEHKQTNIDIQDLQPGADPVQPGPRPEQVEPTQTADGDEAGEQGAPGNNRSTEGGNGRQSDVTPD